MKEVKSFPNGIISYDKKNLIVKTAFFGDISDEAYKNIWKGFIEFVFDYGIEKIIIDQSKVTSVPFQSRAWVVVSVYPRIKRDLSPDLAVAIIASSDAKQRSGLNYLIKAVKAISGYTISIQENDKEASSWLNEVHAI